MPCSCDRREMWDGRVGKCNRIIGSEMVRLEPLRDGWTDFHQESSIPRISLRKPLPKGTVHYQKPPSSLKKSVTSSRKETRNYTKLGSETQIEQLTKEFHTKATKEINNSSLDQCKAVYADEKTSLDNGRHEISIASNKCSQITQTNDVSSKVLPYLGVSVNVITKSIFEHLKLARLKKTNMLVEMAAMTKRSPTGIVENVPVKINEFLLPSDFVFMDTLNTRNETMILGRPFLATIYAEIDVFNKEISLGIEGEKVTFC
ncbi:reverse transcriptase domain-containing protein [Tanacetum coccineum]